MFRDGAIYYGVMVLVNLANMITYYTMGSNMKGGLSTFASSISVTMMSRLMLNLHKTADEGLYSTIHPTISTEDTYLNPHSRVSHTGQVELDTVMTADLTFGMSRNGVEGGHEEQQIRSSLHRTATEV
ncbi:hypothetical protein VKT23_010096 [Stygiomarasmius scandens]|uniref:Uncharacterized protein n=1 Tax=Marasmiellus scandens TaxID=2682957 RepID=A0ABR1JD11_9AGAR